MRLLVLSDLHLELKPRWSLRRRWTDYALDGDPIGSARIASETMKDHDLIGLRRASGETAAFMPGDAMAIHQRHKTFIDETLATPFDGPTVVVTHHAPSARSVAVTYKDDDGNPAYASDLEPTLLSCKPDLWVHGHVHNSNDYRIGATRVVSNPKGYGPSRSRDGLFRKIENRAFNPALVIEI